MSPEGGSPGVLQAVIPEALRPEVLADLHEGVVGGHLGTEKTLGRLGHYNDCAASAPPAPKARAPLQPILTSRPLELVATDIVGPLPESQAYILVLFHPVCRSLSHPGPVSNHCCSTTRRLPPKRLHSDQGETSVIAEAWGLRKRGLHLTTPNRTVWLRDSIATAVTDRPLEWEEHLRRLCFA